MTRRKQNLRKSVQERYFQSETVFYVLKFLTDDQEMITDALHSLLAWKVEGAEASTPAVFDVTEGIEVVPLERKHEIKVDKAMALWAQAACGHIVVCIHM